MRTTFTIVKRHGGTDWEVILGEEVPMREQRQFLKQYKGTRSHPEYSEIKILKELRTLKLNRAPAAQKPAPAQNKPTPPPAPAPKSDAVTAEDQAPAKRVYPLRRHGKKFKPAEPETEAGGFAARLKATQAS